MHRLARSDGFIAHGLGGGRARIKKALLFDHPAVAKDRTSLGLSFPSAPRSARLTVTVSRPVRCKTTSSPVWGEEVLAGSTKNVLGRTTANCDGRIVLTRYRSSDEARLSTQVAAGNLADNSERLVSNCLNLFDKSL